MPAAAKWSWDGWDRGCCKHYSEASQICVRAEGQEPGSSRKTSGFKQGRKEGRDGGKKAGGKEKGVMEGEKEGEGKGAERGREEARGILARLSGHNPRRMDHRCTLQGGSHSV